MYLYGQRFDPLQHAWRVANSKANKARAAGNTVALAAAEEELKQARAAIKARDEERKAKRRQNKELRARGIDPTKKPEALASDDYQRAVKTLRAAIQPQFSDYKDQILKVLLGHVNTLLDLLSKCNGDALATAAYPATWDSIMNGDDRWGRLAALRRDSVAKNYAEIKRWTTRDAGDCAVVELHKSGQTDKRTRKSESEIKATLEKEAHEITERDFDSYAQKLAGKIAQPVERAVVIGKLWQNSILLAHIEAGFWNESKRQPFQRWKTRMILNHSCLGKLFNQWPTRRIVSAASKSKSTLRSDEKSPSCAHTLQRIIRQVGNTGQSELA